MRKGFKSTLILVIALALAMFSGCADESMLEDITSSDVGELSPAEIFEDLEQNLDDEEFTLTLSDNAIDFLKEHAGLFPPDTEVSANLIDDNYDYRKILKNSERYGEKLINIQAAGVLQAFESELDDGKYFTEILAFDGDCYYYIFYIGELEDVVEGELISCIGLPIGDCSFSNISGGTTICIPIAASQVELIDEDFLDQYLYDDWDEDWYDDWDEDDYDFDFDY